MFKVAVANIFTLPPKSPIDNVGLGPPSEDKYYAKERCVYIVC